MICLYIICPWLALSAIVTISFYIITNMYKIDNDGIFDLYIYIWQTSRSKLNIAGSIIVNVCGHLSALPMEIICATVIYLIYAPVYYACKLFYKIFKRRDNLNADSSTRNCS